jgi:hypothetical protein
VEGEGKEELDDELVGGRRGAWLMLKVVGL